MYVVEVDYTAPLEAVDAVRREHLSWVDQLVNSGVVIAAGRRSDSAGGVMVCRAPSLDAMEELLAGDPYLREDVAMHSITEFHAGRVAPGLEHLADGL